MDFTNEAAGRLQTEASVLIGTSTAATATGRRIRAPETPVLIGTSAAGTGTGRRARGREYCPALQPVCLCAYN